MMPQLAFYILSIDIDVGFNKSAAQQPVSARNLCANKTKKGPSCLRLHESDIRGLTVYDCRTVISEQSSLAALCVPNNEQDNRFQSLEVSSSNTGFDTSCPRGPPTYSSKQIPGASGFDWCAL